MFLVQKLAIYSLTILTLCGLIYSVKSSMKMYNFLVKPSKDVAALAMLEDVSESPPKLTSDYSR